MFLWGGEGINHVALWGGVGQCFSLSKDQSDTLLTLPHRGIMTIWQTDKVPGMIANMSGFEFLNPDPEPTIKSWYFDNLKDKYFISPYWSSIDIMVQMMVPYCYKQNIIHITPGID